MNLNGLPDSLLNTLPQIQKDHLFNANALERQGRSLRRAGKLEEAAQKYDEAREHLNASGLAYHGLGDSELAKEVRRAINRCRKLEHNIRHPSQVSEKRPAATLPRPNCLACDKPLRRVKFPKAPYKSGIPREWGDYGDNRFCGLNCGYAYACANTYADAAIQKLKK